MSLSKRIIFCLYFQDGFFYLSRNFSLQKVGDINWLIKNFNFSITANYIDELTVILVKKNPKPKDIDDFIIAMEELKKNIFIPITLGGNIREIEIAKKYFRFGADKVLVNTAAYNDKDIIRKISKDYGSQSISIMVDYRRVKKQVKLYSNYGAKEENISLKDHLENLNELNCGEIILNSIDNDGNGAGLDYSIIEKVPTKLIKPLLIMGGAGKPEHLFLSLKNDRIFGVVTANLFNFLGTGLKDARIFCLDNKINLANFY